jgi:hypothetical protein
MPSSFVVPRRNVQTLCTIDNGRLLDLHPVPIPIDAQCEISADGWIAWAEPEELNPVYLWHCDAEPGRDEFAQLRLPANQAVDYLAFHGNDLWLTGWRAGYIARCPLDSPPPVLIEIPTPLTEHITHPAFGSSRMYAATDNGKQKRLLCFSVEPDGHLSLLASKDLPRRNQDDFLDISVGGSWVAVLEWTFSFCEESCHLRIFHPETLAVLEGSERISVTTSSMFTYPHGGGTIEGAADWKSLAWARDVLLLASGPCGVGVLDLRELSAQMPLEREIRYLPTPGNVQRIVPCPDFGMVLAVMTTPEGLDTIVLDYLDPSCS